MSINNDNENGIRWTPGADLPDSLKDWTLDSEPKVSPRLFKINEQIVFEHAELGSESPDTGVRRSYKDHRAQEGSIIIKALVESIRQSDARSFSVLLRKCNPLGICTKCANFQDNHHGLTRHDAGCQILSTILEQLLSCSVDSSAIVQALIKDRVGLHGAHETVNGRRLWFWAALKDHTNLVSYMLTAGFPINLETSVDDQSILAKALPSDSDTLPQGITALFAALITNSYNVVSYLIKEGAALKLHFHEHKDVYTVPMLQGVDGEDGEPVVVDAMMVLAPRFPKSHPSAQNDVYLKVIEQLISCSLDPSLPSNLWIKASSIFFMSLSQGRPSHQYVQEISFLLKVALYGQLEVMEILVKNGVDIEATAFQGLSLLHFATRSTNLDMVEYVAELLEEVDMQDCFGYSALHHAVALDLPDIVRCLLEWNADINLVSKNGLTPLHLAVSLRDIAMCDLLLQNGAEVNTCLTPVTTSRSFNHATDWNDLISTGMVFGSTPLMSALCPDKMVYIGTVSADSDTDVTDMDSTSDTTNSLAKMADMFTNGSEESLCIKSAEQESLGKITTLTGGVRYRLVNMLLQHGAKPCEMGYFFKKRLDLAKKNGGHDWEYSPFAYEVEWCYPLSLASRMTADAWSLFTHTSLRNVQGTSDVVRAILDAAKSQMTPYMLSEALSAACFTSTKTDDSGRVRGRFRLSRATIEMVLDKGANPNQRNNQNFTLLHLACIPWRDEEDQRALINRLLQEGAYIEARCPEGKTPLHWAAAWNFDAVQALLRHGADTFSLDDSGRDPLHYACSNPDSFHESRGVRLLLQHRYHKESQSGDKTRLALASDNEWSTEECEVLNYLIDPGLPQHTNFALLTACRKRRTGSIAAICRYSQLWTSYSLRGQQGATPLIEAVKSGSGEVVSLVLRGIAVAYHDRRSSSADTYHSHGDNAPIARPSEGVESESEPLRPNEGLRAASKQNLSALSGGSSANPTFSKQTLHKEIESFYKPPPRIEGLRFSERSFHKGQVISHDKHPTAAEVAPLDSNARAACLNAKDHFGWTALHYAAAKGSEEIMQLLLEEPDIDLEPMSSSSETPLDMLQALGEERLVERYQQAISHRNTHAEGEDADARTRQATKSRKPELSVMPFKTQSWFRNKTARPLSSLMVQNMQIMISLLIVCWCFWRLLNMISGISHIS